MTENSANQRSLYMTRRIGSTTYRVKVAFADDASETMEDKILRMIRNEGSATGPECGTIGVPQVSRQSERSAS
jgi:hypothetical protein